MPTDEESSSSAKSSDEEEPAIKDHTKFLLLQQWKRAWLTMQHELACGMSPVV